MRQLTLMVESSNADGALEENFFAGPGLRPAEDAVVDRRTE